MVKRLYCKAALAGTGTREDGRKVFTFLASSDAVDRQDEIVTADGWELDNYAGNPVVLDSHRYYGIENIVGSGVVRQVERGLEVDVLFNSGPRGRLAEQLVEDGSLRAVSVGFVSLEMVVDPKGREPAKHVRKELLEVSVVPVPANPEAVLLEGLGTRGAFGDLVGSFVREGRRHSAADLERMERVVVLISMAMETMGALMSDGEHMEGCGGGRGAGVGCGELGLELGDLAGLVAFAGGDEWPCASPVGASVN